MREHKQVKVVRFALLWRSNDQFDESKSFDWLRLVAITSRQASGFKKIARTIRLVRIVQSISQLKPVRFVLWIRRSTGRRNPKAHRTTTTTTTTTTITTATTTT